MSQPTPPSLLKAKLQTIGMAGAAVAVTAGLTMAVTSAPEVIAASDHAIAVKQMQEDVKLAASIGIYPTGPVFQAARMAGLGTPDAALNTLQNLASLIGQDGLATTIEGIRSLLAAATDGITLPIIGNIALPDMRVPGFGPAGIIDATDGLQGSLDTQATLSIVKTLLLNLQNLNGVPSGTLPPELAPYLDLIANLPLNVPGTSAELSSGVLNEVLQGIFGDNFPGMKLGGFVSSADRLSIIPSWGFGGTNVALASPTFLNDPAFKNTAILAILLRNTSRPGGGIAAMLNPFSKLVGLNLANMDGRGDPQTESHALDLGGVNWATVDVTKYDGNLTYWDITAAYDLLSDAPSTIYNPLSWLNSGVGFVMPTYLIPSTVGQFLDGDILGGLANSLGMLKIDVSQQDGNLYITYDSGNLPLLEPFQFLPRTLSYFPGFNISTPVTSSLDPMLRTLVATGYQDVKVTDADGDGVYTFVRGWDKAGQQANFWESPIGFTEGAELPQTVMNELITGLQNNLLDPTNNHLELFGNNTLTDLLYNNGLAVPVAQFISDGLEQVRQALNPVINQVQGAIKPVTDGLDSAANQVKQVIDSGLATGAEKTPINLTPALLSANRFVNRITAPLDNGIPNAIGNIFSGATTQTSGTNGLLSGFGGGTNNTPNLRAAVAPQALGAPDSSGSSTNLNAQDFLSNLGTGKNARAIAQALKGGSGSGATSGLQRQLTKSQNSLAGAQERTAKVAENLKKGDIPGAARQIGDNIQNRMDRAERDLNNGLGKVGIKPNKKKDDSGPAKAAPEKKDHAA